MLMINLFVLRKKCYL